LKHVAAWRAVVSEGTGWHLILEDDVLVASGAGFLREMADVLSELPIGGWDLLFVGLGCDLHVPWWKRSGRKRVYFRGWRRGWLWGGGGCSRCTEAYLIHPEFAAKLLVSRFVKPPFERPIDWLLNAAGESLKARSYWAEPPLVTQGAFESWMKGAGRSE
jgi:GR25 family glycosyltransferase involved in LPS biosynthesis